jgi:hypothetical protein
LGLVVMAGASRWLNPLPVLQWHLRRSCRGLALCAGLVCSVLAPSTPALAALQFSPYSGQGNVSVFDAAAGTGGWVGSIQGPGSSAER